MKIFIVGSGKLADAILASYLQSQPAIVAMWDARNKNVDEKAIVIHAGSGRQLNEIVAYCTKTKSILIELATGLETQNMAPEFPLIICPNTSVLLLKTLSMINKFGGNFENYTISITESHQSTKTTEPGTAYYIADSLKFPRTKIVSIRDPESQLNSIGIPQDFLNRHAYHKIVMKDNNDEVTIETKVLGHDSYANGVKAIVQVCQKHNLENKKYTVMDLIEDGIL